MPQKILLVDDEELILKSIGKLLQKQGYEVVTAGTGEEAVNIVQRETVDLVVLDMRMPQMNGVETIKAIRQYQKKIGRKTIPEIFITGYADEAMMREVEGLKVSDCLYKPFDIRDFLKSVKKQLS
jgi:CheY-like chemotaxis protein